MGRTSKILIILAISAVSAASWQAARSGEAFSITDAINQAVKTNPGVGEAAANRKATEAELHQSQGALLPQVRLDASAGPEMLNQYLPPGSVPSANNGEFMPGREVGITVSVGLSGNKFLAKLASELDKPRGFAVIGMAEARSFLRDKKIGIMRGAGKVTQATLERDGFVTIGQLQDADPSDLARRYAVKAINRALEGITVPTVVLDPTEDTLHAPDSRAEHERHFSHLVDRRLIGAGHNLPQERPDEFAAAVLDLHAQA